MDAAKKLQADREYVDRFFHGVASKLMTHPYFSKFANQTNIAAEVPASAASLGRVLAAVAEKKEAAAKVAANAKQLAAASAEQNVVRTAVSLDQYTANMKQVRELFQKRSTLLQTLKTCPKAKDVNISTAVQKIDNHIKAVYASGKPQEVSGIDENMKCTDVMDVDTNRKADVDGNGEKDPLLRTHNSSWPVEPAEPTNVAQLLRDPKAAHYQLPPSSPSIRTPLLSGNSSHAQTTPAPAVPKPLNTVQYTPAQPAQTVQPAQPSSGGQIQKKHNVKRGKTNKNKRPQ